MNYNNPYELYHHGILGMKWGVRRWQNKDGSLTPAGKERYNDDWSDDAKSVATTRSKSSKEMSNAELRRVIERMNLEKQYSQLNKEDISKGKKAVNTLIKTAKTTATIAGIASSVVGLYLKSHPDSGKAKKIKGVADSIRAVIPK